MGKNVWTFATLLQTKENNCGGTQPDRRNSEEDSKVDFMLAALLASPVEPPLYDRDRFPSRQVAYQAMQFNRAYRHYIEARRWTYLHEREHWDTVLAETDYLFHCWDWLHAAQGGEGRDEAYWRYSLKRLQNLLGEEAYYSGQMPPPVPLWRFRTID